MRAPIVPLLLLLTACQAERITHTVPYVIVTTVDEGDPFRQAVDRLRAFRGADVVWFDTSNFAGLRAALRDRQPDHVAVVLKPADLDVNLARRFLMLSTELDDDPFSDFAYGFITGATGPDALAFVENIIKAEQSGIEREPLRVGGLFNHSLQNAISATAAYLAPVADSDSAIALHRGDPGALAFFQQNQGILEGRRVLALGYQGDPHGLWLFADGVTPWPYDPARVESPPDPRPGVGSAEIAKLDLYPAVVYSAMSQSGVPARVLVDRALAPTFGDTGGTLRFHQIGADFALALAVLKSGAIGYFAPVGTTNGFFNDEDVYHTFLHDEPLGEIHKRAVDRLVMGFLGNRPRLELYSDGDADTLGGTLSSGSYRPSDFQTTSYMISFQANRIFFGDPMLDPFSESRSDQLRLVTTRLTEETDGVLRLEVTFNKPARIVPVSDEMHHGGTRVSAVVELPAAFQGGVKVELLQDDPNNPVTRLIHALERRRDKTLLHVELDIPAPSGIDAVSLDAVLQVTRL